MFLFGFAKSERGNIDAGELTTLKEIASAWLSADAADLFRRTGLNVVAWVSTSLWNCLSKEIQKVEERRRRESGPVKSRSERVSGKLMTLRCGFG